MIVFRVCRTLETFPSTLIVRFIPPRGVYTPLVLAGPGAEGAEKHWILGPWGLYPPCFGGFKNKGGINLTIRVDTSNQLLEHVTTFLF